MVERRSPALAIFRRYRRQLDIGRVASQSDKVYALLLPGMATGTSDCEQLFSRIVDALEANGIEYEYYSPTGYRVPWERKNACETNMFILTGHLASYLEARPAARAILLVAYSASGILASHAICDDVLPSGMSIYFAGFASKLDLDRETNPSYKIDDFLYPLTAFRGQVDVFSSRLADSMVLWGSLDDWVKKDECHVEGIRDCQEIIGANHQTILNHDDSIAAFRQFLEKLT